VVGKCPSIRYNGVMGRKKKSNVPEAVRPDALWEILTEMQINGRNVRKGTELKIRGWAGRYRFIKYVKTEKGVEWVDVWGGNKKSECYRSCSLEMVKTVHSKNKTDQHLAKEYKAKKKALKAEKEKEQNGS
jgi:hypothetical protein